MTDDQELVNIQRTEGRRVTRVLPKDRPRSPHYPFQFIQPAGEVVEYDPPRPEPTYTFWRRPNDTFPLGPIVYFMYSAGRIKIGFSDGLRSRVETLKGANPFPPVVLLVVSGGLDVERQFHARFAEDRTTGEWFRLSPTLRAFFRARLCPVGRASLKKCEADFKAYCEEILK